MKIDRENLQKLLEYINKYDDKVIDKCINNINDRIKNYQLQFPDILDYIYIDCIELGKLYVLQDLKNIINIYEIEDLK